MPDMTNDKESRGRSLVASLLKGLRFPGGGGVRRARQSGDENDQQEFQELKLSPEERLVRWNEVNMDPARATAHDLNNFFALAGGERFTGQHSRLDDDFNDAIEQCGLDPADLKADFLATFHGSLDFDELRRRPRKDIEKALEEVGRTWQLKMRLNQKLLPVYIKLREMGYSHSELTS